MKLRIPYFEVKRMIEKAFEDPNGKSCLPSRMKALVIKRYLGDSLIPFRDLKDAFHESEASLYVIEQNALNKITKYLKDTGKQEYITELRPTV